MQAVLHGNDTVQLKYLVCNDVLVDDACLDDQFYSLLLPVVSMMCLIGVCQKSPDLVLTY